MLYGVALARRSPLMTGSVLTGPAFGASGSDPVVTGSGSGARAVASGKRVFISRMKPSSVSTLAAIRAIWANSALEVATG